MFKWFSEYLHLIPEPSMRHYIRAAELKAAGPDWVKALLSDAVPVKTLLVAKLRAGPSFAEERDRVEAFKRLGVGGRTTYHKWAGRISRGQVRGTQTPSVGSRTNGSADTLRGGRGSGVDAS